MSFALRLLGFSESAQGRAIECRGGSRWVYDRRVEGEDYRRTSRAGRRWRPAGSAGARSLRRLLGPGSGVDDRWSSGHRPGEMVLELGGGVGDTGFEAAAIIGEDGRLIWSDFAPDMVEVARRRGRPARASNIDYRVIDAEQIELDADSVDGVLCQSAYMLMADPAAALAETRRVLRPAGGWRSPCGAPRAQPVGLDRRHDPDRARTHPAPGARGTRGLQHGERGAHRALLAGAGFRSVRTEEVPVRFTFATSTTTSNGSST